MKDLNHGSIKNPIDIKGSVNSYLKNKYLNLKDIITLLMGF
jgi:hypothetical protein